MSAPVRQTGWREQGNACHVITVAEWTDSFNRIFVLTQSKKKKNTESYRSLDKQWKYFLQRLI